MTSELKGIGRCTVKSSKDLAVITLLFIGITIMCDMNTPKESVLWIYNNIYPSMIFFVAVFFPVQIWQYALVSLQFGASRRVLYYVIEKMCAFILILSLLLSLGMNEFGKFIYGTLSMEIWEMGIVAWVLILMESVVMLKFVQYLLYRNMQELEKKHTIKITALIIGMLIICLITLFLSKSLLLSVMLDSILNVAVLVIFVIALAIIIVGLSRKNYQLFMQREV